MSNIHPTGLLGLENLLQLSLDKNSFTSIPVEALENVPHLEDLSLSVNKIESVTCTLPLPNLKSLSLEVNKVCVNYKNLQKFVLLFLTLTCFIFERFRSTLLSLATRHTRTDWTYVPTFLKVFQIFRRGTLARCRYFSRRFIHFVLGLFLTSLFFLLPKLFNKILHKIYKSTRRYSSFDNAVSNWAKSIKNTQLKSLKNRDAKFWTLLYTLSVIESNLAFLLLDVVTNLICLSESWLCSKHLFMEQYENVLMILLRLATQDEKIIKTVIEICFPDSKRSTWVFLKFAKNALSIFEQ